MKKDEEEMQLAETLIDILQQSRNQPALSEDGARLLDADSANARAAAICAEISQTMLPRKLTFMIGDEAKLVVDAGARRLLRIIRIEPDDIAQPAEDAFSFRDDKKLAHQSKSVGQLLGDFAAVDGVLTVLSGLAEGNYAAGALGFVPAKLLEISLEALKKKEPKKSAAKAAPEPEEDHVEIKPQPAPPEAAKPKVDATAAMKAMIRQKTEAAAEAKAAAAAAPAPAPRKASGPKDDRVRAFYSAVEAQVLFCAIVNSAGNVESASGQAGDQGLIDYAGDIVADMARWRKLTSEVLSKEQIIVMRAAGVQNQSVAYFADDYGVAIALFSNTDLSRIFQIANKILVPKDPA